MLGGLITIGQAAGSQPNQPSMLPMFVIFGIMFFWMYRSQKKEKAKREALLASVKSGDKIVTTGGVMGEVVSVKDNSYIVKIAEKVNIEIVKNGIGTILRDEKEEGK